jgi:hypothetical protein
MPTPARLKMAGALPQLQPSEVRWLTSATGSDENTGDGPYETILVEFKK